MDASLSNVVTIIGLLIASVVACIRAFGEIFKAKAAGVYTILAGTCVALLAVYADKIVVK